MLELSKDTESGTLTVLDTETQEWREFSEKERKTANFLHNRVLAGVFVSAMAIKEMFDKKLYLALNCSSKDEYISTMLPYSRSQAYRFYAIGNRFGGFLGDFESQTKQLTANLPLDTENIEDEDGKSVPPVGQNTMQEDLGGLGLRKLYELTRLDEPEFEELIKTGKTQDLTLEEIKDQSAKELNRKISDMKRQYSGKISQLQEEVKQLKEEKKIYEKVSEEVKTKIVNAIVLERQYGGVASKLEDKQERIQEAYKLLNDFAETLVRCGVSEQDPLVMQQQLVDLIRQVDGVYNRIQLEYEKVIVNIG